MSHRGGCAGQRSVTGEALEARAAAGDPTTATGRRDRRPASARMPDQFIAKPRPGRSNDKPGFIIKGPDWVIYTLIPGFGIWLIVAIEEL